MSLSIDTLVICVAALFALRFTRDAVLVFADRYAARPVMERLATHEDALKNFAIETREALLEQTRRLDALKAPQNHQALTEAVGARRPRLG
jgi:hypothetical protein